MECMQSGLMFGAAAMVDGLIDRMEAELGRPTTVVATGGVARFVVPLCRHEIALEREDVYKRQPSICRFLFSSKSDIVVRSQPRPCRSGAAWEGSYDRHRYARQCVRHYFRRIPGPAF